MMMRNLWKCEFIKPDIWYGFVITPLGSSALADYKKNKQIDNI